VIGDKTRCNEDAAPERHGEQPNHLPYPPNSQTGFLSNAHARPVNSVLFVPQREQITNAPDGQPFFCDRLFQAFGHEGYKEAGQRWSSESNRGNQPASRI
jgi:hypothetical protein